MAFRFLSAFSPFISCRRMTDLMTDHMEGGLSGWVRWRAALHMRICPHCRCLRSQLEQTRHTLADLPGEEPPTDLADHLWQEHRRRHGD